MLLRSVSARRRRSMASNGSGNRTHLTTTRGRSRFLILAGFAGAIVGGTTSSASAQYQLAPFDVPGAVDTFARGINNRGQIVGTYRDADGSSQGFLFDSGVFTPVRLGEFGTELNDINDQGETIGTYIANDFSTHAFRSSAGQLEDIALPDTLSTTPQGLNNRSDVSGYYTEFGASQARGFLLTNSGFVPIEGSGGVNIFPGGLNDRGTVVGSVFDTREHGFVFENSTLTPFDLPGASETFLSDINNVGEMVGFYESVQGRARTGFVWRNGMWQELVGPEASFTNLMSINDAGLIVGYFAGADGRIHSFTATPVPEPTTICWLAAVILSGSMVLRRRVNNVKRRRSCGTTLRASC